MGFETDTPGAQRGGRGRPTVSTVKFEPLDDTSDPTMADLMGNLEMVRDVKLEVTVELGRTNLPLKDVVQLGDGSVINLDKLAGEPVDLLVSGKVVARGEVVVIGNNFGIKVTQIMREEGSEGGF